MFENEKGSENDEDGVTVSNKFLVLLFLGLGIVIVGIIIVTIASVLGGGSGSVGGVVFIGPFPIVFGAGPDAMWLIIISLVIAVLMFVLFFVWRRRGSWKV